MSEFIGPGRTASGRLLTSRCEYFNDRFGREPDSNCRLFQCQLVADSRLVALMTMACMPWVPQSDIFHQSRAQFVFEVFLIDLNCRIW